MRTNALGSGEGELPPAPLAVLQHVDCAWFGRHDHGVPRPDLGPRSSPKPGRKRYR